MMQLSRGNPEIVDFLLKSGADHSIVNNNGKTAVQLAKKEEILHIFHSRNIYPEEAKLEDEDLEGDAEEVELENKSDDEEGEEEADFNS
jgi:ankyrin repeat protein